MSAIDDLPPLREVIRQHALSARKSLGQNFLLDLNLTARIARAAGPLEDATVIEIGPGPGGLTRALLALGARRVIAVERDERALGAARGDLQALSRTAGDRLRRRPAFRSAAAARRRQGQDRRQPALQHRDRAADRLAVDRAVAALVRHDGADVSARGGRAHRRPRKCRGLWPARRARELARRDQDPVRHFARGLRAAAQGHLVGGAAGAARRAGAVRPPGAGTGRRGGVRPAPQDAAAEPEIAGGRSGPAGRGRRCRCDAARRDRSGRGLCCHGPRIDRYTKRKTQNRLKERTPWR